MFEDSLSCLQEATSLVRLGLLTNTQSFGLNFLGRLGLSEKIPYRFISANLGLAKPDPNIFKYAQKSLGLFPGDLVMVGIPGTMTSKERSLPVGQQFGLIERVSEPLVRIWALTLQKLIPLKRFHRSFEISKQVFAALNV